MKLRPSMRRQDAEVPRIVVPPPGPKARAAIEIDARYMSPSYTRPYPLVVDRARGAVVEDVDGNRFLDFTAGIAVCSTGHCHPQVVAAIREQAGRLLHMSGTDFYYLPQQRLAERLAGLAPGPAAKRAFLTNSGAEAVEAALKLVRYATGRKHVIAFFGAFHGRTLGALSLTASKAVQRARFGPLVPEVTHVAYPNPLRGPSVDECLGRIEEEVFRRTVAPAEVAAFVVEPIQGEGGYIVPPEDFHPRLKALAERHGICYVVDEVQTGIGRTGRTFAIEHWGVVPDVVCVAKGIASGMPLGAIIADAELMSWPPGAHGTTFGGNPVACAAALATLDLVESELTENARVVGAHLLARLRALGDKHAAIGDVRGLGLMVGVELVDERGAMRPAPEARERVVRACFEKGLLLLGCGESTVRFCPPLIVTERDVDVAVGLFDAALGELAAA